MAIAMRMATLMQLHREETYVLVNPTKDLIIRAESARRTLVRRKLPSRTMWLFQICRKVGVDSRESGH